MEDNITPGKRGTGSSNDEKQDTSPIDSLKGGRVTYTRGPESSIKSSLIWADAALEEFENAERKIVKALRKLTGALTTIRGAKTVTKVEVRDALCRIVVGLPQSSWVRIGRTASIIAIFGGGAGLSYGLQKADGVICALSVAIGLFSLILEEILLRYKKYP